MSKKRLCLHILSIAVIAVSGIFLVVSLVFGVLARVSGDGTVQLFGSRFAAVEITADPNYPRGSLVRLQAGSIPENTPVAVRTDGVLVLSDNRLSSAVVGGKALTISREQIMGSVDLRLGRLGWILLCVKTTAGFVVCVMLPLLFIATGTMLLLRMHSSEVLPHTDRSDSELPHSLSDVFPELDYRLRTETEASAAAPAEVKTLVITQTRAASSAIRSQKGEVRIFASGQEKVLPLNAGKRVVSIGGYTITVDITRSPERTEDITKELPVIRSGNS